jgi:phosphate transport system substrate-binding protein
MAQGAVLSRSQTSSLIASVVLLLTPLISQLLILLSSTPALAAPSHPIRIDGSSTVYPIVEALAEEYQQEHPDAEITIGVSGTGGGFKKFCAGELEIATASRPIQPIERSACEKAGISFREIPVATDAIVVVVHPKNSWAQCLTTAELRTIWEPAAQGKLTTWRQLRPDFPDRPVTLYGPGTDSGTFDYFTEAIVGTAKQSRGDYTASEDDNVLIRGVAGDPGALGYFSMAYYLQNQEQLKAVAIRAVGDNTACIMPSSDAVKAGNYRPLARPLFLYVAAPPKTAADVSASKGTSEELSRFVEFATNPERGTLIEEVGFVPNGVVGR